MDVVGRHREGQKEAKATILTSATLATGRSFGYQRRRLGLDGDSISVAEFRGEEIFDYGTSALVYVENEMCTPDFSHAEDHIRESLARAAELVRISEGRALVLLATKKAREYFGEHFAKKVAPYPV